MKKLSNNAVNFSKGELSADQVALGFEGDVIRITEVWIDNGFQKAKGILESHHPDWTGSEVRIIHLLSETDKISLKVGEVYPRSMFRPLREFNWDKPFQKGISIVNTVCLDLCLDMDANQLS
ncbi:MAG TPA: hypothetical protein VNQ80_12260 [Parapedobacter sp.]|uniref:hypothetical protein n=1 Tax=Parapedobacter sp. TaxID=1958893 RepID=UPI002CBFAA22|nr:hypothetical protein [Parapedobacter sp.]HWK58110.1 hypothetical protein [Parapedobacter sp.]